MKKYVYILLITLILLRLIHKIHKTRKISENSSVSFAHTLYEIPESCYIKHGIYRFYLPRCSDYNLFQKIRVFGKVLEVIDKPFYMQKTLKVQSIEVSQSSSYSPKFGFVYILRPIVRARIFFLKKTHELWSKPYGSLIGGFVFGFKEKLPEKLMKKIKVTGMQHVVVASGFNVSLVMLLCSSLLAVLNSKKIIKSALIVLGIFVYGLISGLSPPLSRALIMAILSIGAKNIFFRQYRPLFGLIIAAVTMLLLNPFYIYDISFQLSSTATLGIILLYPVLNKNDGLFKSLSTNDISQIESNLNKSKTYMARMINYFFDSFCTTVSAQGFTLPLLLYHFAEFSLVSLPSNTFLLWLTPFITYAGFFLLLISAAFSFLPINLDNLLQIFSFLAWLPSYLFVQGVDFFGKFESWYFTAIKFPGYLVIISWLIIFGIVNFSSKQYEKN